VPFSVTVATFGLSSSSEGEYPRVAAVTTPRPTRKTSTLKKTSSRPITSYDVDGGWKFRPPAARSASVSLPLRTLTNFPIAAFHKYPRSAARGRRRASWGNSKGNGAAHPGKPREGPGLDWAGGPVAQRTRAADFESACGGSTPPGAMPPSSSRVPCSCSSSSPRPRMRPSR
jgi:hypothetical protein